MCSNGIVHDGECFFLLERQRYDYNLAQALCVSLGARLAEIEDNVTYALLDRCMRNRLINYYGFTWPSDVAVHADVWLGASYEVIITIKAKINI